MYHLEQGDGWAGPEDVQGRPQVEAGQGDPRHPGQEVRRRRGGGGERERRRSPHLSRMSPTLSLLVSQAGWRGNTFFTLRSKEG